MPAIIAHYLMSKASAKSLSNKEVFENIKQHSSIFYLGAQGPDILLFALGNKELNALGERMHREGIKSFYSECINRLRKTSIHDGRGELSAYMAGFLCHYALDTCTHPYIYYKTGFSDEDGNLDIESTIRHRFFETTIDCILSNHLDDKDPFSQNVFEKISIASKKRVLIGKFLSDVIASSYNVFIYPEDLSKALKDIAFVYKMLSDKTGKKRAFAMKLSKVFRGIAPIAALIHYTPVNTQDYLNERRDVWYYPWDDAIDVNLSFMDLFIKAVEDSAIYINAFEKTLQKQLDDKIALSILGNKNFSTGLESPVKFLYYNIEFNKFEGKRGI